VGFDYSSSCCEVYGYFFSNDENEVYEYDKCPDENNNLNDVADYVFDKTYHEYSSFGMRFRLVDSEEKNADLYLTVFNEHNGYYAHGLDMNDGDTVIINTCI
jgi:hypothetical protein